MVEPVDVAERGELDVLEAAPRSARVDELPLVEPVETLGHSVVVAVAAVPTEATMSFSARRSE